MLDLFDNVLLQSLGYGIAVLGLSLSFRILRYPDLTADGAFVLGAVTFAAGLTGGVGWGSALLLAILSGAAAGALTGILHFVFGISRLLTGILTLMIAYSLAFRILGGQPNVGILNYATPFSYFAKWDDLTSPWGVHLGQLFVLAFFALAATLLITTVFRTEFGLVMRATGGNIALARQLGHIPALHQIVGLALANGLIASSAALISANQGFADINMGVGVIIMLVAALVVGEEFITRLSRRSAGLLGRIAASFCGTAVYYAVILLLLRGSIRGWIPVAITPTDLKMMSAVFVIGVMALRRSRKPNEEVLPF